MSKVIQATFRKGKYVPLKAINVRDYHDSPDDRQAMGLFKHIAKITKQTQASLLETMVRTTYIQDGFKKLFIETIQELELEQQCKDYFEEELTGTFGTRDIDQLQQSQLQHFLEEVSNGK